MKLFYVIIGVLAIAAVTVSVMLIPDSGQLHYMVKHPSTAEKSPEMLMEEKQAVLESEIAQEGLVPQTVGDLADSYVAQGKVDKAIALMERYHAKHPADLQMLDKLGVIYHVAGQDDNYIHILEEENELAPSVNTSYILQARYSILYGDTKPEKTIVVLRKLIKLQPDNIQNYRNLIFFLFKAHKGNEVITTIRDFKKRFPGQMDYSFTFALVDQLIKQHDYQEAYDEAAAWIKHTPDPALRDFSTMFFNAGRTDMAMELLAGRDEEINKDPILLLLTVKTALAHDPKQALGIASGWMKTHPSDNKILLDFGNIFFSAKHYDEVAALYAPYQALVMGDAKLRDIYLQALLATIKMHRENVPVVAKLYEYQLKDPATTPAQKKSIIYSMQDIGAENAAMPYARQYAFQYRGDWVFLYEALLKKRHDMRGLAAFRKQYVHTVQLTDKERHYFASIYLDEGNKPEAERLLWQLAASQPAKSKDVQGLVYLWGSSPGAKQLTWVEQRATVATGQDKLDWLQILMNMHAYDRVIKIVKSVPRPERTMPLLKDYFDALRITKNKAALTAELTADIDQENNETYLAYYAQSAKEQGFFPLAARGYERLMVMNPTNIEYTKDRGMVAYYMGDIETAKTCLDVYYEGGGKDVLAIFYFAELLQQHNTLQAKPLFEETINLMEKAPSLTLEERVIKIHSLVRLHRYSQATDEMAALMEKNPDNKYLQLDYVEFLIDLRQYKEAKDMLAAFKDDKPFSLLSMLWRINRKDIVRVDHTQLPNELVLVYGQPTGKIAYVKQLQHFHPAWVTGFYPGYDTVLITAKPERELSYAYAGVNVIIEAKEAGQAVDSSLAIRKELLYARIEQETHRGSKAIARLTRLMQAYPNDAGVITGLAIAKRSNGQHLQAMDLAQQAHELDPENRWINIMLADMHKEDAPLQRADADWVHLTGNDQFTTSVQALQPVSRNVKLGAFVEDDLYSFKNLQLSNGEIGHGSGSAQRGFIDALYEFESGPITKTLLYLNPDFTLGVGEEVTTHDFMGKIMAYGEYHRSDWTFTERIADNVTRDRIGVMQNYSPIPEISTYFGAAATEYNQDSMDDVTQSVSLSGGIHAPVALFNTAWEDIPMVVGYGLDAEYVTSRKYGMTDEGDVYRLYPLISREVHVIDAAYRDAFDESLTGELTGGFAYDRLSGEAGPSLALRLTKTWDHGLEGQLHLSHGLSFTESGSGVTDVGGYLQRKF